MSNIRFRHLWILPTGPVRIQRKQFKIAQRKVITAEDLAKCRVCKYCGMLRQPSLHTPSTYVYNLAKIPTGLNQIMQDNLKPFLTGWTTFNGCAPYCVLPADSV